MQLWRNEHVHIQDGCTNSELWAMSEMDVKSSVRPSDIQSLQDTNWNMTAGIPAEVLEVAKHIEYGDDSLGLNTSTFQQIEGVEFESRRAVVTIFPMIEGTNLEVSYMFSQVAGRIHKSCENGNMSSIECLLPFRSRHLQSSLEVGCLSKIC